MKNEPICIIGSQVGIYAGQWLADYISAPFSCCTNLDELKEAIKICETGPDTEDYIECWLELESAQFRFNDETWYIYPNDGDIWLIPESFDVELEWGF